MDQADDLKARLAHYLALPEDDVEGRLHLAPSEEDLDQLHALMIRAPENRDLYYQASLTRRADQVFHQEGRAQGWTVAQIRQQLARVETRNYADQGESIQEVESFRFWPVARHLHRIRKQPKGGFIDEIEWDFLKPVDLAHVWQKLLQPGFEEETLLLAQRHADVELVKEMFFLPPAGITYRIIFKAGEERKTFISPTSLRYEPLLKKFVKENILEDEIKEVLDGPSASSPHRSVEMAEGYLGLWQAVMDYDPEKVRFVPGYIELKLTWHFGDAYDRVSTESYCDLRNADERRIFKTRLERVGGEFDAPLGEDGEQGATTLRDTFKDPRPNFIGDEILFREIIQALPDPTDRQIVWEKAALDATQQELAETLGITQPAIAKRLKKIQEQVRKLLAE